MKLDLTKSQNSESVEEEQTPDSFPQHIKSIITSLRVVIDQIDSDFKQAKELILEIARRLDEEKLCERDQISRTIKILLKDKIEANKITEKWIEEYKRQYIKSVQRISIPTADQIPASEFEFIIPKEKYEIVRDAIGKSKSAIFVKCNGSKKFVRALADVDN